MTRVGASVLVVAALATRAFADPKAEAKKHLDKAMKAHADGKFADALTELTLAYSLDPQPKLLYAIGQVHVKLGQCSEAIDFYQRFLGTHPPAGPAAEAQQAIDTCKKAPAVAEPPPPPPPPPPEPVKPPPEPVQIIAPPAPPSPPIAVHRAFYTDVLGDALVGAGVIAGAIGAIEYSGARSDLDSADKQTTYAAHQKLVDDASSKRTVAIALGAGGAVLVGGGIVRYLVHDRSESGTGVAIAPAKGGGLVTWSARF